MGVSGDSVVALTDNNLLVGSLLGHENGGKVEVGIKFRALAMVFGGFWIWRDGVIVSDGECEVMKMTLNTNFQLVDTEETSTCSY